jgi:hypothetical protein
LESRKWYNKVREGASMKKYLIPILCGLIFTGHWMADETFENIKNNITTKKNTIWNRRLQTWKIKFKA